MANDDDAKFDKWNEIKKSLQLSKSLQVKIAHIFWLSIGQNVGCEVYGKGSEFRRPVLVIKKVFNNSFLGVPLTSKQKRKNSFLYYKFTDSKGINQTALLTQLRLFDTKRVKGYKARVSKEILDEIKESLKNVLF